MKITILGACLVFLAACGHSNDSVDKLGAATGGPALNDDGSPPACHTLTSSPQDTQALADIAKMTKAQCQQNFQQVLMFYQDTQGMSDAQRQAYFQQQTQGVSPAPPPPPPLCSVIFEALKTCAETK